MHLHDPNRWRALTEEDGPLEHAAQQILAVRLSREDAAACLPPGAKPEQIEKLRSLDGFTDHINALLHLAEKSKIFAEEADERGPVNTHLVKAVKHIAMIRDGLHRLARADTDIPRPEEEAIRNDITHGNEHGLYDKIADHFTKVAVWIKYRTTEIEQAAEEFEEQQKKGHAREPGLPAIPVEVYHYNEALQAYRDLHPECIRATAKALGIFQQEYDRVLGDVLFAGKT